MVAGLPAVNKQWWLDIHPSLRWLMGIVVAFLLHAFLLLMLAIWLHQPKLTTVVAMVPKPDSITVLDEKHALIPTVTFSYLSADHFPDPRSVSVYFAREENEALHYIGRGQVVPDSPTQIRLPELKRQGRYEVRIKADGSHPVLPLQVQLDGEYNGYFPTGDGVAGGDFVASFLIDRRREILTADIIDERRQDPILEQRHTAPSEVPTPVTKQHSEPLVTEKPLETSKRVKRKRDRSKKSERVSEKKVLDAQQVAVAEIREDGQREAKAQLVEPKRSLAFNPVEFNEQNAEQLAADASRYFERQDVNDSVVESEVRSQRIRSAYRPAVLGNDRSAHGVKLNATVTEFISQMHEKIHPLWGWGFLVLLNSNAPDLFNGGRFQRNDLINDPSLEARVEITLDSRSRVLDVRILKASGVARFDAEAIDVAWQSSPDRIVPKMMLSANGKTYIHWTFWRDQRQCGTFGVRVMRTDNVRIDLDYEEIEKQDRQRWGYRTNGSAVQPRSLKPTRDNLTSGSIDEKQPSRDSSAEGEPQRINPLDD